MCCVLRFLSVCFVFRFLFLKTTNVVNDSNKYRPRMRIHSVLNFNSIQFFQTKKFEKKYRRFCVVYFSTVLFVVVFPVFIWIEMRNKIKLMKQKWNNSSNNNNQTHMQHIPIHLYVGMSVRPYIYQRCVLSWMCLNT